MEKTKYPGVTRWRLREDVAFVDTYPVEGKDPSKAGEIPEEAHYPHLIDNIYEEDQLKGM